jgi:outer membrane protein OmpA-like peptidoglycan-associated protein
MQQSIAMNSVVKESHVKLKSYLAAFGATLFLAAIATAQAPAPQTPSPASASTPAAATATPAKPTATVSRTTVAVNFRRAGNSTHISFQSTELMQGATGDAKVDSKSNRMEIEAKFENLDDATKFGLEYLTYVLWAVSPQGRAVNLGELTLKNRNGEVKAITDLQTFGMIVTAEPYFGVTQPGNTVVLENTLGPGTLNKVENIDAKYELLGRGIYSSSNTRIDSAIFGIDRKTPLELFEARNAVRIAHIAQAEKYAPSVVAKAEQQLRAAEETYQRGKDKKSVIAAAREVVQTAEEARVMSVKQKAEEDAQAAAAAEKKAALEREVKARADADAEIKRRQDADAARLQAEQARQQAETARQQAEVAKAEAERMKQEADAAAAEAAHQKHEAELAKAAAIEQQQAALAEADKARQAAAKAESEKADLRAQLLNQLNSILQTRDSARGLIVNMSDVLFDTGSSTLKPGAREKLAKISGIVLAHPGLNLQIEGHTDSVGTDDFNQQLSERRADAVRDFLAEQGVPASAITARGFGKTQPVASNDTAEGRQRNRRVELVVNGDAIGNTASASSAVTQ